MILSQIYTAVLLRRGKVWHNEKEEELFWRIFKEKFESMLEEAKQGYPEAVGHRWP